MARRTWASRSPRFAPSPMKAFVARFLLSMASKAPRVFASAQKERCIGRAAPGGDAGDPVFSGCGGRIFGLARAFAADRLCHGFFLKQAPIAAIRDAA